MYCEVVFDASGTQNSYNFAARITLSGLSKSDLEEQIQALSEIYPLISINYIS